MNRKRTSRVKVRERKLGRELALGLAYIGDNLVEIDPRQRSRTYLNTLLHELLHLAFPSASESRVKRTAGMMTRSLWDKGFRKLAK